MEYLAVSYPGESVIRLIEPRTVHTELPGNTDRRGERTPPGDRLTLVYDEGGGKHVTGETDGLTVRTPLDSPKIYVLQARTKDIRDSPFRDALLAYRRAQMMGEAEVKPFLDIRV